MARGAHRAGAAGVALALAAAAGLIALPPVPAAAANPVPGAGGRVNPSTGDEAAAERSAALAQLAPEAVPAGVARAVTQRDAALAATGRAVLDAELATLMARRAGQEAAREKNWGATPKDAGPTEGMAPVLYPHGETPRPAVGPLAPGTYTLSATFGEYGWWEGPHHGQDFAALVGTPVFAAEDAVVGVSTNESWAGNHVVLYLADGSALLYAHLDDTTVTAGQIVRAGDLVGHVGSTGRSFGPHLHFEYTPAGVVPGDSAHAADSLAWLVAQGVSV